MKIAIILYGLAVSRSVAGTSVGMTVLYLTKASAYKDSTRIFTRHVDDPQPGFDFEMFPAHFSFKERARALAKGLRRYRPDIIEIHHFEILAAYLARRFPFTPIVSIRHHGLPIPHSFWTRLVFPSRMAGIICISDSMREVFKTRYPSYDTRRIVTLHNAVPFDDWLSDVKGKEKLILFVGRAADHKGLTEYVEGLVEALPDLPGWRAAVITVELREALRDFRAALQQRYGEVLGDRCQWLQGISSAEVAGWMKRAAILVAPSKWLEPFGLVLAEAHLSGVAVISSGRGGMPEVSGRDGAYYLSEVSPHAIAEAVSHLAGNDDEREALAQRGQDYVLKHHRIEDRAAELDQLRRDITGKS